MLKRCPNCGSKKLSSGPIATVRTVAGHVFTAGVPGQTCADCGERIYQGADLERFDLEVAAALAGAGITDGEAVRYVRKAIGLQTQELAELLDMRPETVSRWQSGKGTIDRAALAVLWRIAEEKSRGSSTTLDALRTLVRPRRLPRRVKLQTRGAA